MPLLSSQLPGSIRSILLGGGGLDELTDKLEADNATVTAYGAEGSYS